MQRRDVLVLASGALSVGIAGCNHDFDDDSADDTETEENGDEESPANDTNGTGNETNGDGNGESDPNAEYADEDGRVPADVLEGFYEARRTIDIDQINDLLHPAVPGEAAPIHFQNETPELLDVETDIVQEGIDEAALGFAPIPEGETVIRVESTAYYPSEDGEVTLEDDFVLATDDGRWYIWDFAWKLFQRDRVTVTDVTGIVGDPGEVHEIRVRVRPAEDSSPVDLSEIIFIEFTTPEIPATVRVGHHEGEPATAETHPEDVEPAVVEHEDIDGQIQDLFGVTAVSAVTPDNLWMTDADDRYDLVVDTSGGEAFPSLESGDSLQITLRTRSQHDTPPTALEIPDIEGVESGTEVELWSTESEDSE